MCDQMTTIENHKIITKEHKLQNESHFLREKKQMILVEDVSEDLNDGNKRMTLVHMRQIDGKCCRITEDIVNPLSNECRNRKVETDMTDKEIEQFKMDWIEFWKLPAYHGPITSIKESSKHF